MSILICDDEQDVVEMLVDSLAFEDSSVQVDSCTTVEGLLTAVHQTGYDKIALDLNMPGLGVENIHTVLSGLPSRTKVVIITGDASFKLDNDYHTAILIKPFSMEEFSLVILGSRAA